MRIAQCFSFGGSHPSRLSPEGTAEHIAIALLRLPTKSSEDESASARVPSSSDVLIPGPGYGFNSR